MCDCPVSTEENEAVGIKRKWFEVSHLCLIMLPKQERDEQEPFLSDAHHLVHFEAPTDSVCWEGSSIAKVGMSPGAPTLMDDPTPQDASAGAFLPGTGDCYFGSSHGVMVQDQSFGGGIKRAMSLWLGFPPKWQNPHFPKNETYGASSKYLENGVELMNDKKLPDVSFFQHTLGEGKRLFANNEFHLLITRAVN